VLYPPGTSVRRRFDLYTAEFDTVELNASFYRWPSDRTFAGWCRRPPPGFAMSVKAHRGLTHFRRLRSPESWAERFDRCWRALGDKAAVILIQLHPELERDDALLEHFLSAMPAHIRLAVEFRHRSWDADEVYTLLERHRAAYVVTSGANLPCVLRATSELVYVRMHGPDHEHLYAGSYSDNDLRWWADRIREWHGQGRDVLVYFNNDGHGYAVRNARTLKGLLADLLLPAAAP